MYLPRVVPQPTPVHSLPGGKLIFGIQTGCTCLLYVSGSESLTKPISFTWLTV